MGLDCFRSRYQSDYCRRRQGSPGWCRGCLHAAAGYRRAYEDGDLGGMDSLLSMVQMPSGVPVACVAINGAKNAAIYATQILGACDPEYRKVIEKMKQEMADA